MRERMERFAVLPFSFGCVSQASIAVAGDRPRRSKSAFKSPPFGNEDVDDDSLSEDSMKHHSSRFLTLPKVNLSTGVNKLVKGIKSLSQLFVYEDEMEELGMEMEIGCPTDVKHVTHIGWDGTTTTNLIADNDTKNSKWQHLFTNELLFDHPTPPLPPPICADRIELPSPTIDESKSPQPRPVPSV